MNKEENCILEVKQRKVVSKEMEVFYNPVMKLNRDLSIILLKSWKKKNLRIADMMAGSGVRAIRFLQELSAKKIETIWCNDLSEKAYKSIKAHFKLNKIKTKKVEITKEEANIGLLRRKGFDYLEVDPFGTPNPFLDSSIKRLSREGILAVTATDTSALSGTYPKACQKKYWAIPLKNSFMHETALRILIRKVQLIGIQYEKPLIPIFCYASDHYVRLYFKLEKSKTKVEEIIKQHKYLLWNKETFEINTSDTQKSIPAIEVAGLYFFGRNHLRKLKTTVVRGFHFPEKDFEIAGPLWIGKLYDSALVKKMYKNSEQYKEAKKLLELILEELKVNMMGSYDVHKLSKKLRKSAPAMAVLFEKIQKKGYKVVRTHTNRTAIKTNMPINDVLRLL